MASLTQLYQEYLGRAPDPEGLAYWTNKFGTNIDPAEQAIFKQATDDARTAGIEPPAPAKTTTTTQSPTTSASNLAIYSPASSFDLNSGLPKYFQDNPDVAASYTQNSYGMSPEQFAETHYLLYGKSEGRNSPAGSVVTNDMSSPVPTKTTTTTQSSTSSAPKTALLDQILASSPETYFKGDAFGGGRSQAEQLANFLSASGITDLNQFGVRAVPIDPENPEGGLRPEYYNKATGKALTSTNNIVYAADVAANYDPNIKSRAWKDVVPGQNMAFGQTWEGPGSTTFNVMFDAQGKPIFNTYSNSTSSVDELAPLLTLASIAGAPYLSGLIGGATGLTGASLAAATGATIGGVGAALTGGDVLKGALLGGAGGYLSNAIASGIKDANTLQAAFDADVAAGMVPEFGTNAAYDAFMSGAMTPAAQAAIESQIAGSSVAGMTPEQILQQGGMITDMASGNFTGPLTADQLGQGFEDYMSQSGYTSIPQADYSNEGRNYPTVQSTQGSGGSPINASTAAAAAGTGLSASQIANLAKAGLSLAGAGAIASNMGGGTGGAGALPTQGVPSNTPEYYQAIQQYYNAYMPEVPRDVATPLQQWYDSKYGA